MNKDVAVDCLTHIGHQLSAAERREIVRILTHGELNTSHKSVDEGEV